MESEFSLGCMIKEGVSLVIKTVMYHNLLAKFFLVSKGFVQFLLLALIFVPTLYSYNNHAHAIWWNEAYDSLFAGIKQSYYKFARRFSKLFQIV